jgi:Ca2+-binding RTX toxin-like protein
MDDMTVFLGSDTVDDFYNFATDNILYGLGGKDSLFPIGAFPLFIYGGEGNDAVVGDVGNDEVYGGRGDDLVAGGPGSDFLEGASGSDRMVGGDGNDLIYGGPGGDVFVFQGNLVSLGKDRIQDFDRKEGDSIELDGAVFVALTPDAPLDKHAFYKGKKAKGADDHVGYDKASGKFYYDENANDPGGRHLLAVFDKGTKITFSDIDVSPFGVG